MAYRKKKCLRCGKRFTPSNSNSRYCVSCGPEHQRERHRRNSYKQYHNPKYREKYRKIRLKYAHEHRDHLNRLARDSKRRARMDPIKLNKYRQSERMQKRRWRSDKRRAELWIGLLNIIRITENIVKDKCDKMTDYNCGKTFIFSDAATSICKRCGSTVIVHGGKVFNAEKRGDNEWIVQTLKIHTCN